MTSIATDVTLRTEFNASGALFTSSVPVAFPLSQLNPVLVRRLGQRSRWQALEQLWADGIANEEGPSTWRVAARCIHDIPQDVAAALELPSPADVDVEVRARSVPGQPTFGIDVSVTDRRIGALEGIMRREGPVYLPSPSRPILLPKAVFELLQLRDAGPAAPSIESHLEFVAQVQALSAKCGASLDAFLRSQEVVFADQVGVAPEERSADHLVLSPTLDLPEGVELPAGVLAGPVTPRIARGRTAGGRTPRIVLSAKARSAVGDLRERSSIRDADVPRFLQNPEAYLPPGLDLSQFSKRVIGFRTVVYNSRPYLHVKPSQGGWFEGIPGLQIEPSEERRDGGGQSKRLSQDQYRGLVARARASGQEYVRHGDGWVRVDVPAIEQLESVAAKGEPTPQGTLRFPSKAILEIYENLEALEFELPPAESIGLARRLSEFPDPPLPETFSGRLLPHQRVGYRWLAHLHEKGAGGLLADDMGLGKTVQVIAHFGRLAASGELKPSLVVCPKTIIENWTREFGHFLPGQRVVVYDGKPVSASVLAQQDIVVTSYDILRHRQLELAKVDWRCVVCDEAQYAKNPTAQRTAAVKALKSHHRMALTGTPVENGLIEFWCILDFVRPGHLGSWNDFREEFERPLVRTQDETARRPVVERLLERLQPHYLRRMKDEILTDLPAKQEQEVSVPLSDVQLERYRSIAAGARNGSRGEKLAAISKLLMICAHPDVLTGNRGGYSPGVCPKLDATIAVLAAIKARGEKALVFTRFLFVQQLLQEAIFDRFELWPAVINGQLTQNRQHSVDVFQGTQGFNVLILSHDVGGVGLNITGANHVIHYTRPWNPAKENQATDRAHRIGQMKPVTVYHPIVTDDRFTTVERRLAELLASKRALARDVLRPSSHMSVKEDELLACLELPEEARP